MTTSHAAIATIHASRYLQQLCKHWSHKLAVTYTPQSGQVAFDGGATLALAATPDTLNAKLSGTQEQLARLQDVVADHLKRFAHKEELVFNWQIAA